MHRYHIGYRTRNHTLWALNGSVFLLMVGVGMIVALLPQKIMLLSHSVGAVGYLAAAFAVSYVLLQVPVGQLADRVGYKVPLTVGYLLCGVTGLLYYGANSANLIFAGRFLQGISEVPIWALAPALLSLHYADNKGKTIGMYNASFHLGLSVGPLLGLVLQQWVAHTDLAFLVYALVSFVGAVIVFCLVAEPRVQSVNTPKNEAKAINLRQLGQVLTNRLTLIVLCGIALYGAGYGTAVTIIPAFLLSARGFDQASLSFFFSLFYIAISLAQLLAGPFSDKRGRHGVMIGGFVLAATGLALFALLPDPWIYGALTLMGLGLGLFCVASLAYLNEAVADAQRGTISGAYYLFWGIGYFLGPVAAGALTHSLGLPVAFAILALLLGIEALCLHSNWNRQSR